jgi:vacuolar-type H+-ATPase subunit F/Vma7
VTGLLLAGIGVRTHALIQKSSELTQWQHVTAPPDAQKNFLVVDAKTDTATIEATFDRFTTERKDIGIVLINQHVRHRV